MADSSQVWLQWSKAPVHRHAVDADRSMTLWVAATVDRAPTGRPGARMRPVAACEGRRHRVVLAGARGSVGWASLAPRGAALIAQFGYVRRSPPRSAAFRRALAEEVREMREFLKLEPPSA